MHFNGTVSNTLKWYSKSESQKNELIPDISESEVRNPARQTMDYGLWQTNPNPNPNPMEETPSEGGVFLKSWFEL